MEEYAGSSGDGCGASTCSSWSDDCKQWRQCQSDRMVKRELDAARALADLSQMAPDEDRDISEDERRGSGSKGLEKRPAVESIAAEEQRKDAALVCVSQEFGKSKFTRTPDSIQNGPLQDYKWQKESLQCIERTPLKDRQDSVHPKSNLNHLRTGMPFSRGKPRKILSEAEKEAKRLRRILANRESARQTILRRQAFCEELTKKAADLAYDNSKLKQMEKELIMKEYHLLLDQNKNLKNQVSMIVNAEDEVTKSEVAIKTELEATPSENISADVERPSFIQQQLLSPPYSRMPYTPFIWMPHYPVQMQNFPQNTNELKDSMASCVSHQIHGQDTTSMPRLPYYMMPWPWFCPPAPWHGLFSSDPHTSTENVGSSAAGHPKMGLTSKSAENAEKAYDLAGGRLDASSSVETISKRDARRLEDGTQTLGPHSKGMVNAQNHMNTLGSTSSIKRENISQSDPDSKEVVSSGQFQKTDMSNPWKLVDASAAAEARKRRKELTKLKYHQSRQY